MRLSHSELTWNETKVHQADLTLRSPTHVEAELVTEAEVRETQ